jgi:VWFA-related protein
MKFSSVFAYACLVLTVPAWAQTAQELPSAPSAVIAPKPAPPAAPAPQQPAQTSPVQQRPASNAQPPTPSVPNPNAAQPAKANSQPEEASNAALTGGDDQAITIKKNVNEVSLVFTVTDKHGHYVRDLKKEDVRILDDNKPPQQVMGFSSETNLPLRMGLLIDESNSIRDRFKFEQEAAIEFLSQVVRHGSDKAFILGFDTTPEIAQDFTDDTEKLSRAVRSFRPGGGTALYDAIYLACRDKLLKAPTNGPVRRALIVLTDGEDNQSRVTREEAIEMAQRAEVIIYAISTNVSGVKGHGDQVLERMADATGGRAFFPFKIQDVATHFSDIQDELRSQYSVSYRPADFVADGHFRSIAITAADNKKYRVRARKGYFSPANQ